MARLHVAVNHGHDLTCPKAYGCNVESFPHLSREKPILKIITCGVILMGNPSNYENRIICHQPELSPLINPLTYGLPTPFCSIRWPNSRTQWLHRAHPSQNLRSHEQLGQPLETSYTAIHRHLPPFMGGIFLYLLTICRY